MAATTVYNILTKVLGGATVPPASETEAGAVELATQAEVDAGTDTLRAVVPNTLSNWSGLGDFAEKSVANTFTAQQTIISAGGSFIKAQAIDVAGDSAFQGHLTAASDGSPRGFFGSIPGDAASYITAYTWNVSAWNRVLGATADAGALQLSASDITFAGSSLIVPAASETVAGKLELATQTEVDTGTDTSRGITPATLLGRAGTAQVKRKTASTGRNNTTTLTADPHLAFSNLPAGTYAVEVFLDYNGDIAADLQATVFGGEGMWSSIPTTGANMQYTRDGGIASGYTLQVAGGFSVTHASYLGRRTVSGGGSIELRWAQAVSNGNATTLTTNSWMRITKLP